MGPMTLSELIAKLEKMSFGPDDEIASSCKPWIPLAKTSSIKRHYPEIETQVLKCEEQWANNSVTKKTRALVSLEKRKRRKERTKNSGKQKLIWTLSLLLVLCLVGGLVKFSALKDLAKSIKSSFSADASLLASLSSAQAANDDIRLKRIIEENLAVWSNKVTTSNRSYEAYMPWVRLYAFRFAGGSVDGFELKYLKGREPSIAPKDCSVAAWKKRWSDAAKDLSSGWSDERLKEKTWYQTLHWDPRWIRRRPVKKEWIEPQSYYEACLTSALAAADESKSEFSSPSDANWILQRLSQQVGLIAQRQVSIDWGVEGVDRLTHPLAVLACLDEVYSSVAKIHSCFDFSASSIPANSWLHQYKLYREINFDLYEKPNLTKSESIATLLKSNKTNFVGFDYQPEWEVLELLRTTGMVTPEQEATLKQKFGGVNLFTK